MTNSYPAPPILAAPPNEEERKLAMAIHLSAFAGCIVPSLHLVAPLVFWLMKRDAGTFFDDHGKEAVNAQISVTIYGIVCFVLFFVIIGFPLLAGLVVANIICVIQAALAANRGEIYRFPLILRFVK